MEALSASSLSVSFLRFCIFAESYIEPNTVDASEKCLYTTSVVVVSGKESSLPRSCTVMYVFKQDWSLHAVDPTLLSHDMWTDNDST